MQGHCIEALPLHLDAAAGRTTCANGQIAYLKKGDIGLVEYRAQGLPHEIDDVLIHMGVGGWRMAGREEPGAQLRVQTRVQAHGESSSGMDDPSYRLTWKLPNTAMRFCFSSARSSSVSVAAMGGAAGAESVAEVAGVAT